MDFKGKYVVFEGVDGTGKSTQALALEQQLKKLDVPVILTREPGSKWINLNVRTFCLSDEPVSPEALELLLQADRAEHTTFVLECLQKGFCVISDRSFITGLAYAFAHNHPPEFMFPLVNFSVNVLPDYVFFLDCSTESSQKRLDEKNSSTREEKHGLEFRERVKRQFMNILFSPLGRDLDVPIMRQLDDVCSIHRINTDQLTEAETLDAIGRYLGL